MMMAAALMTLAAASCDKIDNPGEGAGNDDEGGDEPPAEVLPDITKGFWYLVDKDALAWIYTFDNNNVTEALPDGIIPAQYFTLGGGDCSLMYAYDVENGIFRDWDSATFSIKEDSIEIIGKKASADMKLVLSRNMPDNWSERVLRAKRQVGDITAFTWYVNDVVTDAIGSNMTLPFPYTAQFADGVVVMTMDSSTALDSFRADYGVMSANYDQESGIFLSLDNVVYDTKVEGKLVISASMMNEGKEIHAVFTLVTTKPSDWDSKVSQFAMVAPLLIPMISGIIMQ